MEILTAPGVRDRVSDEAARGAVDAMTRRFGAGDLSGGLIAGVEALAHAAGPGPASGEELPDLLQG